MPMSPTRKLCCRAYQAALRAALPVLPYRMPKILGSAQEVAPVLAERHVSSVLLVTGPSINRLGLTQGLRDSLVAAGIACAVYDKTVANPTTTNVEEAAELYRTNGCQAIIGFGGGSPIDCAKAAGARIAAPGKSLGRMRGVMRVHRPLPLLLAVPTTAGSGSEATLAAVITDEKTRFKYPINDFALIPSYAVLDASLTVGLPPAVTAQTGMDALTHAVEAYVGRSTTTFTRARATEAVCLIHESLLDAYRDGGDLAARRNMLTASHKAGLAFTRSYVGYVHGIAHSLSGQYDTPHGLANAVILPHVLRAYGTAAGGKLAELSRAAGIAGGSTSDANAASAFIAWIDETNAALGIPSHLGFIRDKDIPVMAARADAESNPLYPVPVLWDAADLERIYRVVQGPSATN